MLFVKEEELSDTLAGFVTRMSGGRINTKLLNWLIQCIAIIKKYTDKENDPIRLKLMTVELVNLNKQLMEASIESLLVSAIG